MTCSNDAVQPHPENPRITWRVTRVTVKKTASTKIHQGLPCNDMCGSSAVPPPPNQQITLTHSNHILPPSAWIVTPHPFGPFHTKGPVQPVIAAPLIQQYRPGQNPFWQTPQQHVV